MNSEKTPLKECPYCRELIKEAASRCYHCRSWLSLTSAIQTAWGKTSGLKTSWLRSRNDKIVFGVCGGLARNLDVDSTLVRVGFVALTLYGGHGILLYVLARLLMPLEPVESEGLVTRPSSGLDQPGAEAPPPMN